MASCRFISNSQQGLDMIAKEDRNQAALAIFLDAHPQLREEIQVLNAREQAEQVQWAFEDEAQAQGLEPWELALQLIAESPEELKAMRLEVHREVADALGLSWEDYCEFNEVEP
jgi:hypothetical protein